MKPMPNGSVHRIMDAATATVRELRLNFRAVKRKMEEHGAVVITANGKASYLIQPLPAKDVKMPAPTRIDYWARLQKRQSKPLSAEATRALHEENRGDR